MKDVIVCFDATDHEPDSDHPSNVVRFANALDAVPLYEPGVGTRLGYFHLIGSGLGVGVGDRIDDQLDRLSLHFFDGKRISVVGGSRGADAARRFTFAYADRFIDRPIIYCCVLFDHVSADGWSALKRVGPAKLWNVGDFDRPAATHSLHIKAGGQSHRFYLSDQVDCDEVVTAAGMIHTQVLHSPGTLGAALSWIGPRGVPVLPLPSLDAS